MPSGYLTSRQTKTIKTKDGSTSNDFTEEWTPPSWQRDVADPRIPGKNRLNEAIDKSADSGLVGSLLAQIMGENETRGKGAGIGQIRTAYDLIREAGINDRNTYGRNMETATADKKADLAMKQLELRKAKGGGVKAGAGLANLAPLQGSPRGPNFALIRKEERANDMRAEAERRRRFRDSQMAASMLRSLGIGGTQSTTEETQEIFNRAGAPERVPIKTTRTQTMSPSEQAQLLQIIMGMR